MVKEFKKQNMFNTFSKDVQSPLTKGKNVIFLLAQLVLLCFIVWKYEMELTLHLLELSIVATCGFIIQFFIPQNNRYIFFLLLSLSGLVLFVGWLNALIVIVYGTIIYIAANYIKLPWLKISILLILFGILAGLTLLDNPWIQEHYSVISILGSMFLYRIWIFLYDLKHQKESPGFIQNLAYFFMLPNMAYLLFPAVDYKLFITKQFDENELVIYKKGVQWMVLGIFHLVIYRFIYYNLLITPNESNDILSYFHYATTNYALILRLSGLFHFAAGVLCLFGYNLPATFNNYFLARGFSDLWRRLNIYFKDFMVKVFYYPIYFKLRKYGTVQAMAVTTMMLFIISWMFHSLQYFWLKGTFNLKWVDAIYWNAFGILVTINAIYDLKKTRQSSQKSTPVRALISTSEIIATFLGMSILWSLWSANTISEWVDMVQLAISSPVTQYKLFALIILSIGIIGSLIYLLFERFNLGKFFNPHYASKGASYWSLAMLFGLLILQAPVSGTLIENETSFNMGGVLKAKLNIADEQLQVEGYYTDILLGNNLTTPLADMTTAKRNQFPNSEGALTIYDYRNIIMKPNTSFIFKDKPFSINRWGFRDKSYELIPQINTVRSLFLGGSFVAGSGVADLEVFDLLLENKMNDDIDSLNYEFLNFGCPTYDLVDCVIQFEQENLAKFNADYLFFFSQGKDLFKNSKDIVSCIQKNIPLPLPYLEEIVAKSGIKKGMTEQEMLRLLTPYEEEILEKSYLYLLDLCQINKIIPVWVYWPTVTMRDKHIAEKNKVKEIATRSGFKIIDFETIYASYDPTSIKVSPTDIHPNALGHKIIADGLYMHFQQEFPLQLKANR